MQTKVPKAFKPTYMNFIMRLISWKSILVVSVITLLLLIICSFYGLYTNKFYFFKFDNYIFPLLTSVHFVFLYVMWFKIKEREMGDPPMRNLEYTLYVIFLVYVFKVFDVLLILLSHDEYESHLIPSTFIPVGITIVSLHVLLVLLTVLTFSYRKILVGSYDFERINENIDSWE